MKNIMIAAVAGLAGTAFAGSTTTYTDLGAFLTDLEAGFYDEGFDGLAFGAATTLDFTNGLYSYTASSGPGPENGGFPVSDLFNSPGILSLDNATDTLLITFTSGNVTAVGGDFLASDIDFFEIPADVTVTLSDGTVETFNSSGFVGFTSDTAITSISIDASDATLGGPAWPAIDRLIVGEVIPAPGAIALLGFGSLAATRRRR